MPIKYEETKPFILGIHYAKRMPMIQFSFGLFFNDELVGVVCYGSPASQSLCRGIAGDEYRKKVLELNRLVLKNNIKNEASFLVSNSFKLLHRPVIIVSYADTSQHHTGYIYQATNFIYTGTSSNTSKLVDKFGEEFHFRNIGHYQKNNRLNVGFVKRRLNEDLIDKKEIANYLRDNKKGYKNTILEKELNIPKTTI